MDAVADFTIQRTEGELSPAAQAIVQAGFDTHSEQLNAPAYEKSRFNWLMHNDAGLLIAALTADLLWDWIYIDELWVAGAHRGQGLGKRLMQVLEIYGRTQAVTGVWLWTQSWQAAAFYQGLGYEEFARFPHFPKGHERIGYRKQF